MNARNLNTGNPNAHNVATSAVVPASRIGKPPMPREHGAWVMLYVPVIVALSAVRDSLSWLPPLLLIAAITGLFLGRNAAALLMRKRGKPGTEFWLGAYAILAMAGALPLLLVYQRFALLQIGLLALLLF